MRRILVLLALLLGAASVAQAQSRIDVLALEFSKNKDATRSKKGVTVRKFHEVVSLPWRSSVEEYLGHYASDEYRLDIRMGTNGELLISGSDPRPFQLKDARIVDGVLTGRRVYRDARGGEADFEAAFLHRKDRVKPGADFVESLGVGFVIEDWQGAGAISRMKVFMVKRR